MAPIISPLLHVNASRYVISPLFDCPLATAPFGKRPQHILAHVATRGQHAARIVGVVVERALVGCDSQVYSLSARRISLDDSLINHLNPADKSPFPHVRNSRACSSVIRMCLDLNGGLFGLRPAPVRFPPRAIKVSIDFEDLHSNLVYLPIAMVACGF